MSKQHKRKRAGLRAMARLHGLKPMNTGSFHTKCVSIDGNAWEFWFTSEVARLLLVDACFHPLLGKWSVWGRDKRTPRPTFTRGGWQAVCRAARFEAALMMCRRLGRRA